VPCLTPDQKRLSDLRRLCALRGLNEAVTWSFLSEESYAEFSYPQHKKTRIANAISVDLSVMRHSVLPNLMDAAKRNADRKSGAAHLFEVGSVFFDTNPDQQPVLLSGLRCGLSTEKTWQSQAKNVDFYTVKEDVWALLSHAGLSPDAIQLTREAPSWYHPGQSATLRLGKNILAHFGVLHPGLLQRKDIAFPVVGFEIFIDALPSIKVRTSATRATLILHALQPVTRDFAFLLANDIPADQILKAARNVDKNKITSVRLFDVYTGKGVQEGYRSIAFSITIQPQEVALTDAQLDALGQDVIAAAQKAGATLRS
jgi:phenylalanyl-tRNA synthetase beta chain